MITQYAEIFYRNRVITEYTREFYTTVGQLLTLTKNIVEYNPKFHRVGQVNQFLINIRDTF